MIKEAKDCLAAVIRKHCPEVLTVCYNATEEKNALTNRRFPFASMISRQGSFDNSKTRQSGKKSEDGKIVPVFVRGERTVEIVLRFWTSGIDTAETYVDRLLPHIPTRFNFGFFVGLVAIVGTDLSDFSNNITNQAVSAIAVEFTADYGTQMQEE